MEETKRIFSKIEDALEDFKSGRIVIVVDDADRENEGDFVCAAQCITEDTVNFMLSRGRGGGWAPPGPPPFRVKEVRMAALSPAGSAIVPGTGSWLSGVDTGNAASPGMARNFSKVSAQLFCVSVPNCPRALTDDLAWLS